MFTSFANNYEMTAALISSVLVVDDDPDMRLLLRRRLKQENYQIFEASNGADAVALYLANHPDVILLDAMMPGMDGFETCKRLRHLSQDCLILMTTALDDDSSIEMAFAAGANDYITKPVNLAVLRHRLHQILKTRAADHALKKSMANLEAIFDSASQALIMVDTNQCIQAFNSRANAMNLTLWGKPLIAGAMVYDYLSPDLLDAFSEHREKALSGELFTFEHQVVIASGETHWLQVTFAPIKNPEIIGLCIAVDLITERKAAEIALRDSEQRYRSIITVLAEGIALQSPSGVILACNASAERILGLTADQMMGRTPFDPNWYTIHEDGSPFPFKTHPSITTLQTGEAFRNVLMGVHKPDDSLTWIRINTEPLLHPGETLPYAAVVSFTDVTTQKHFEDALKKSETEFRRLVENTPDFVARYDCQLRSIYANPALIRASGMPLEDFIGKTSREIGIPEPFVTFWMDALQQAIDTGQTHVIEYQFETTAGTYSYRTRIIPEFDDDGKVMTVLALSQDITDQKKAERQTVELLTEKERTRVLTSFIQNASHEFRTPLSIISNSLYLLRKKVNLDGGEQFVNRVNDQINNMVQLLDVLLTMSELDTNPVVKQKAVNLATILNQIEAVSRFEAENKNITLALEVAVPAPLIQGDEDRLMQAFIKIMDNAILFTPEGGTVTTRIFQAGAQLGVEIRDTGIGIPAKALPFIFDRFYRADQAHSTRGFGLGLAIAKRIIDLHQGTIEAESTPGAGSIFRVWLPLAP